MSYKLITAPTLDPVTLAEAKARLRVTHSAEDALITDLIKSATILFEEETESKVMPQVWERTVDNFPDAIQLDTYPVTGVVTLKYTDANNVEQTLASNSYLLDNSSDRSSSWIVPAYGYAWPSTYSGINGVRVRFNAGYANAAAVPYPIKQWIMLQVGNWYANRESVNVGNIVSKLDYVDNLIKPFRLYTS